MPIHILISVLKKDLMTQDIRGLDEHPFFGLQFFEVYDFKYIMLDETKR